MSNYPSPKMPPNPVEIGKRVGVRVESVEEVIDLMRVDISGRADLTITDDMVVGWILSEMYYGWDFEKGKGE